jgi:hypothetical protein
MHGERIKRVIRLYLKNMNTRRRDHDCLSRILFSERVGGFVWYLVLESYITIYEFNKNFIYRMTSKLLFFEDRNYTKNTHD